MLRRRRIAAGRCACSCRTTRATCRSTRSIAGVQTPHVAQLSSLTYDGLVAYRRLEGAAAATLVGALATTAPSPSPDGRTYVFTLRRGLRFSDGRPVRPADFRASMERFLQVTRRRPEATEFPPLYASIAGARRCSAGRTRCDLSRGIETDPRARTITVHLTRRDADFLHKLTMAFGPSSCRPTAPSAPRRGRRRPAPGPTASPPGTGVAAGRSSATRTSDRARRARARTGFADRIDGRDPQPQDSGDADRRRPERCRRPRRRRRTRSSASSRRIACARCRARSPGRLYSAPAPTSDCMFLNVRAAPVRRHRSAAGGQLRDRPRAPSSHSQGDRRSATPACQVLPLAFPAYEPYCPYTARPSPGGKLDRARHGASAQARRGVRASR